MEKYSAQGVIVDQLAHEISSVLGDVLDKGSRAGTDRKSVV